MATINGAVSTNNVAWVGWSQTLCNVALSSVSVVDPAGTAYMQIYRMALNLSGKDASRTVALGVWTTGNSLIGKTANFTESAASSASSTGNKTLTTVPLINRTTTPTVRMGFWVSGNGSVYYSADETGQTTEIYTDHGSSSAITTFTNDATLKTNASLVGSYDYYTLPSAPASITGTAGQAQVTLDWTAPASNGGTAVTSYTLQRATDSGFTTGLVTTTGLTGLTTTVTGLTNGTAYYFRIAAVNAVATAASTTSAYATIGSPVTPTASTTVPGPPTALTVTDQTPHNDTGLALSWTAPASNGGSAITGYEILASLSPDMSSAASTLTGSTSTSYDLDGLEVNTTYYLQVSAINAIGTGPTSATAYGQTYTVAVAGSGVIKKWNAAISQWVVVV